jgi:hypothetical protein
VVHGPKPVRKPPVGSVFASRLLPHARRFVCALLLLVEAVDAAVRTAEVSVGVR